MCFDSCLCPYNVLTYLVLAGCFTQLSLSRTERLWLFSNYCMLGITLSCPRPSRSSWDHSNSCSQSYTSGRRTQPGASSHHLRKGGTSQSLQAMVPHDPLQAGPSSLHEESLCFNKMQQFRDGILFPSREPVGRGKHRLGQENTSLSAPSVFLILPLPGLSVALPCDTSCQHHPRVFPKPIRGSQAGSSRSSSGGDLSFVETSLPISPDPSDPASLRILSLGPAR